MLNTFRYSAWLLVLTLCIAGCSSNAKNTVLQDFGLQERSEDYVSGSDRVMTSMRTVGITELKRLNILHQRGEIKFQASQGDLSGKYYKEVKRYQKSYPIAAQPMPRTGNKNNTGFTGTIDYSYEMYEGPRFNNKTEAEASNATIPSGIKGRESFRYIFTSSGTWNGGKGKATSR